MLLTYQVNGQSTDDLELLEDSDLDVLLEEQSEDGGDLELSDLEELDDLESLKKDIGGSLKLAPLDDLDDDVEIIVKEKEQGDIVNDDSQLAKSKQKGTEIEGKTTIFEVGEAEKDLLEVSKFLEGKIPRDEWNEISAGSNLDRYVIQEGDWLWKISQKLFGSGFYYSKIWSLNPHITNPHEIEPGMTLVFDTGSSKAFPKVRFGEFATVGSNNKGNTAAVGDQFDFTEFGENTRPPWLEERKKLMQDGTYFQFASEETYDDLAKIGETFLRTEHEKYTPPLTEIIIQEPGDQYDDSGFDKDSRISFDVKEGFFLNTFVTSNLVQDLGEIDSIEHEGVFIQKFNRVYVRFDKSVKVKPGDLFSVYSANGKAKHKVSDRSGFRYSVTAQIEAIRRKEGLWECEVKELSGLVERKDRITVYTPKINRITRTFNRRNVEAAVVGSYSKASSTSFGDVVYLDRGRADGVEMGNVFQVYGFKDRGTGKRITKDPTYKIGELTVITLTDNFATALVTQSSSEFGPGAVALTKTQEEAARDTRVRNKQALGEVALLEKGALDELDVELNLDDISQDLLDQADKVQLTEDELEELERQEREKSIIKGHERDLKELERLENEIVQAEALLNESKVDEDKFLEQQDLNLVEKKRKKQDPNAFESLNEIENDLGRKYMDEDLNSKENPYGLTEFDLEEIDELLNTESL